MNRLMPLFALLLFALCAPLPLAGGEAKSPLPQMTIGEAINVAGRQRMLSQRILKNWCLVGQRVAPHHSRQHLLAAVTLYDRQLQRLAAFRLADKAANQRYRTSVQAVQQLWPQVRAVATGQPTRAKALPFRARTEQLLARSHELVLILEASSGNNVGHLVNISGRQRMLSQRIASLYLLDAWGVSSEQLDAESQKARLEFTAALEEMTGARETTPEIGQQLQLVSEQWGFYKQVTVFNKEKLRPANLAVIDAASDVILQLMDDVTALYAEL